MAGRPIVPARIDADQPALICRRLKKGEQMASGLQDLSPLTVGNNMLTTWQLLSNIPMLHLILEEVVEDWIRAVEPYQKEVDDADGDPAMIFAAGSGIMELRRKLLKCLFSYPFVVVATDNAYGHLYAELNRANNDLGLNIKHEKPPKDTPIIEKIRLIRDKSIAHFPGTPSNRVSQLEAYAAMSWDPGGLSWSIGSRPDLEKLSFGSGRFVVTDSSGQRVESKDLEVPGVRAAHEHCLPYLNEYDKMCCDYLEALQAALDSKEDTT